MLLPQSIVQLGAASGPLLSSSTSLLASTANAACVDVRNCFDLPSNVFEEGAGSMVGGGSGFEGGGLIFLAVCFFLAGVVRDSFDDSTPDEGSADAAAIVHPSAISKPGASTERKKKQIFGWLHVRDVYSLPTYQELLTACHFVGNGVGDHEGYEMYLCASDKPSDSSLSLCEMNQEFTNHYAKDHPGAKVHLCRGGPVPGA